ncbi:hypothetical protein DYI81_00420 [Acinetobacter sp. SWAC5]|uniref:zinc ribbon-containing protein n=1 Tax=Acinetobacter sp. SWAC5 TaxID=2293835 RepID=UPI000E3502E7|nr:hypothetical protein [Acinetobacter sp. SWAC5]RFS36000.1 hypothetical protein DYI81_00420 [Acinetobacter sp. SWAC5]
MTPSFYKIDNRHRTKKDYTLSTISKNTWRTKMVIAGSKPGTGFYFCVQCGHRTYLEIGTDRLPPCTKCLGTEYNDKVA